MRLFVEQAGGQAAISLVQVRTSNSGAAWTSLTNVYGSDWEVNNSPAYPLDVSVVGPDGQTVSYLTLYSTMWSISGHTQTAPNRCKVGS